MHRRSERGCVPIPTTFHLLGVAAIQTTCMYVRCPGAEIVINESECGARTMGSELVLRQEKYGQRRKKTTTDAAQAGG